MSMLLRVGIVGLGPHWRRHYKPALGRLKEKFQIRSLCDQLHGRALEEARRLGCHAAAGPTELLTRDDIQALLLLDTQWFGLWPLEIACRLQKPVFCASSLANDDAHADGLAQQIEETRTPVVMALTPRFTFATARLRELLATQLGQPRLLLCDVSRPQAKRPQVSGKIGLRGGGDIALVDWCLWLLGCEPQQVLAAGNEELQWRTLILESVAGLAVQITRYRAPSPPRSVRVRVVAEGGSAIVELPGQINWTDDQGEHSDRRPGQRSPTHLLLEHFWEAVQRGAVPQPTFRDAYRGLTVLRAAALSHAEGRRVSLPIERP
jgi:predicted dehydrogenase